MNVFSKRKFLVIAVFVVIGLIFIISLFRLQVLDSAYKQYATNNVLREEVQYPARGLVYDRNGKLLVYNKTAYDLKIIPREVIKFDTLLLCSLLDVSKEELELGIQKAKNYSWYKPSTLIKQISPESFAVIQEQLYKFEGFHAQSRTLREYSSSAAAHALGYVGEVNVSDLENDEYYTSGDYIGKSGIEKTYENQLRGVKGVKKKLVDVHNREQGSYKNGSEDIPAQIGKNLVSTLDLDLQLYAEKLFQNKKGSIVAIEPSSGEVLAMVSAPAYDPGLLVGRVRGDNYSKLVTDTLKPLFNRSLQAKYPPGSTFKPLNVLIGLQENVVNLNTTHVCYGKGSTPIRCTHDHGIIDVIGAIEGSCNPFLWNTFKGILSKYPSYAKGFNVWRDYVASFGIGQKISSDFSNALRGDLPSESLYNKIYGEGHWSALTVRSLSIGQGELGVTPLQMANYGVLLANRGYYYAPHIIKEIENEVIPGEFKIKHEVQIDKRHFDPVITGMSKSVQESIIAYKIKVPGIEMCGKTGTVENNQGSDHSVFVAFAPRENPKIAIFVYVENGGYGATHAAPMASLMVEKYLTGSIASSRKRIEKIMLDANLLNPNQVK